jgi:hypothetical protein
MLSFSNNYIDHIKLEIVDLMIKYKICLSDEPIEPINI